MKCDIGSVVLLQDAVGDARALCYHYDSFLCALKSTKSAALFCHDVAAKSGKFRLDNVLSVDAHGSRQASSPHIGWPHGELSYTDNIGPA